MSIIVNLRTGDSTTEVRCQRINQDPLVEGNFLLEGVSGLELTLNNGDALLPHTMSVPKGGVIGYYGGELITREQIIDAAGAALKELSLKKRDEEVKEEPRQQWRGIEGTTYSA